MQEKIDIWCSIFLYAHERILNIYTKKFVLHLIVAMELIFKEIMTTNFAKIL